MTTVPAATAAASPAWVPILTYHSLDDSGSVISVGPASFRAHMEVLVERGQVAIGLGDLVDLWNGKASPKGRPVVLTFDDAFVNVLQNAVPVLAKLGFRATVFAIPGYCGHLNDWPSQSPNVPRLPLMTVAQLRELAAAGIELGAHTVHHRPLRRIPLDQAEAEIVQSKAMLEDATGASRPVRAFSYPYGDANAAVRRIVASHFEAAVSTDLATASAKCDRHWLPRIDMYYLRSPRLFRLYHGLPAPLRRAYMGLRAIGRKCRAVLAADPGSTPATGREEQE